ncbi:BTB/POZ domain-containing protein 6-like isoform X1 [Haliotis rufescens]|uniref:BTB/POZ domain-containing protein 6-like isoform X1 n=2 Tax=Haliotis rufescens TaxID=6454 RepID=UPI00201F4395|nr:BTB/POZ domain-containing protein 6-like isoform X1 [Haliotis rufescens]
MSRDSPSPCLPPTRRLPSNVFELFVDVDVCSRSSTAAMAANSGFVENWQSGRNVAESNLHMLKTEKYCDVHFRVGKQETPIRAHSYVLISRSCVFEAMLRGPLAERDVIRISDVDADTFSEMLTFLYTNDVHLTLENVTGLLYLAKKYAVRGLETLCLTYLEECLTPENACLILEHAHRFDEKDLYDKAFDRVIAFGDVSFGYESFTQLCHDCFDKVILVDELSIKAENVYQSAMAWVEAECGRKGREITPKNLRSILGETVYGIPFISMEKDYYVDNVVPRGILTDAENVKIMSCLLCPEKDPSPFIRRSAKPTHSVMFYKDHRKMPQTRKRSFWGRTDVSCSHDGILYGVSLYGHDQNKEIVYHIRICDRAADFMDVKRETVFSAKTEPSGKHNIFQYWLREPRFFKRNTQYFIYVEMEGGAPTHEGDPRDVVESIAVEQCTVHKLGDIVYSSGHINITHGLVIGI